MSPRLPVSYRVGIIVMPFFTEGDEGLDVNTEKDWWYAEHLLASGSSTP